MHRAPNSVALLTPFQGLTGCGSFQRNSPTGGAANGMPLKITTFPSALLLPATSPASVGTCTCAPSEPTPNNTAAAAAIPRFASIFMIVVPVGLTVIFGCSALAFVNCEPGRPDQIQISPRTV